MPPVKVVLLSCGSFNPPTNMHLRIFELARDQLNKLGSYQVIGGVVSPVHDSYSKKDLVSATHRCALLRLALSDTDWIHLSDWECTQDKWLRTREVLQHHQNLLNAAINSNESCGLKRGEGDDPQWISHALSHSAGLPGVTVKLLCGADLLESFGTPGLWLESDIETIIRDHGLVVVTRCGTNPMKFIYESDLLSRLQNNIQIVTEWIANEVSSTKIRRSFRRGESVKYLVPTPVINYIREHGLYGSFFDKPSSGVHAGANQTLKT